MGTPHKHAEVIKAWADGAEIEYRDNIYSKWTFLQKPNFDSEGEYRIKPEPKPEPKPDVVKYMGLANHDGDCAYMDESFDVIDHWRHQLKLTFDGETGKLKAVEIIK